MGASGTARQSDGAVAPVFADDALVIRTDVGEQLQKLAPAFASRKAGKRFLGYLEAQRQRLVGERGQRDVNRVELVEQFGYDTKYAMHMLRLGHQGVEFLESGRLTLPMREPVRSHLMDVRQGRSNLADVLAECTELELRLGSLLDTSPLPVEPDLKTVESFVMDTYGAAWARRMDCSNDEATPSAWLNCVFGIITWNSSPPARTRTSVLR